MKNSQVVYGDREDLAEFGKKTQHIMTFLLHYMSAENLKKNATQIMIFHYIWAENTKIFLQLSLTQTT